MTHPAGGGRRSFHRRVLQPGLTLVELMVGMALGLLLVALVFGAQLAGARAAVRAAVASRLADDAAAALTVLRAHVAQAGRAPARGAGVSSSGLPRFVRVVDSPFVRGCDGAFGNVRAAFEALDCDGNANGSDAVALRWEADALGAPLSSAGLPLDCLGNGIALTAAQGGRPAHYRAEARFYVATSASGTRPELYCRGSGATAPQPLVEGVEDLQIEYLLAPLDALASAPQPATAAAMAATDWARVTALRVCVVVVSAQEVADQPGSHTACDGSVHPSADRRLRLAVSTVIGLHTAPTALP